MHRPTRRARWTLVALTLATIGCGSRTVYIEEGGPPTEGGVDAGVFCSIACDGGTIRLALGQQSTCTDPQGCDCYVGSDGGPDLRCYTCAAPDTPIATPEGYRPIASLSVGDLVYSENRQSVQAVPIRRVSRTPVDHHAVVRAILSNGMTLRISPRHPTADGRSFADLSKGDALDQLTIVDVALVPYEESFTYDILPDSDTGTYIAGGALVGSTLWQRLE
jgi:hypothetical protein